MEIIAGMLLLCSVELSFSGNKIFLKDVETKVHHITKRKFALLEYNFSKNKNVRYLSLDGSPEYDVQTLENLRDKNYANCRKISNEQEVKK